MLLRIGSSHSDSFTYPAESQEESHTQDAHGEEDEEFVYPGIGDVDAVSGVLPVPSSDTITFTPSPSGSQVAVPLDSSDLTEYPSSDEALHETSPPRPDPNPNPSLPAQPHASPAQLEALYAAASSGDLSLLQRIINNALQTGNVESFSLVNGASSRTGLTALHAAASRGYIDIVKWCKASLYLVRMLSDERHIVIEACGAIIDLEDREGEV
jgi:Ankyrin repeats (many copies)